MNATHLARNAYASHAAPIRTDRGIELEAFSRITKRITPAHAKRNYPDFVQALHENRRLWTLLAVDVADRNNRLPQALRARIFYLAEFTLLHTSKVLTGEASAQDLVDINQAIMIGLRQQEAGT